MHDKEEPALEGDAKNRDLVGNLGPRTTLMADVKKYSCCALVVMKVTIFRIDELFYIYIYIYIYMYIWKMFLYDMFIACRFLHI